MDFIRNGSQFKCDKETELKIQCERELVVIFGGLKLYLCPEEIFSHGLL